MTISKRDRFLIGTTMTTALSVATVAHAATFHCANQDVQCLINSIAAANTNGNPANTIWLDGDTYTLVDVNNDTDGANGLPSITSKLTIVAKQTASIVRDASAPRFRLIQVAAGGNLTLGRVTLSNGFASQGAGGGGAVLNDGGVVTIWASTFVSNSANLGGGLLNNGGLSILSSSTFSNNSATGGGGLNNLSGEVFISGCTFDQNDALRAGGIDNTNGTMQISRSFITNNEGHFGAGGLYVGGGAVWVDRTTLAGNLADGPGAVWINNGGTLFVKNSAFVGNKSVNLSPGPAIGNFAGGTVVVSDTTFAGNVSIGCCVGVANTIYNAGKLTLVNSTFAGGVPGSTIGSLSPIIVSLDSAVTILANTILAHTSDESNVQDCRGPVTSFGNNIIGDPTGCGVSLRPSDHTGDPGLNAFADDGTPGNGHFPLLRASQAIDAGDVFLCPKKDQIGQVRVGTCDIGAIEFPGQ